ncbi:MAG: twin-arginine translocation signal domain-containing protein [Gammaproteobacteria bacterium]|nr:twin-arginine translocation signal domain-containing protein [Gammaproteobacteria bacterium]
MKKTQDQPTKFIDASRRGFLQRSAVASGVAATGTLAVEAQADSTPPTLDTEVNTHAGYRLTDKVKEYYRKARF